MVNWRRFNNNITDIEYQKYYGREKTAEVRDIIERMPKRFGYWISMIAGLLFILLLFFGWLIRYPDVVEGRVTLNTTISPIKLIANTSGKIQLVSLHTGADIKTGDVLAYIESATNYETLNAIKNILDSYNPNNIKNTGILPDLPGKVALGELTPIYYSFVKNLQQLYDFNTDQLYDKQISSLKNLYDEQHNEVLNSNERVDINKKSLVYTHKLYQRDSILFRDKVTAEAELDKRQLEYLNSRQNYANAASSQIESRKQAQQTISKITEVNIQKSEKRKELELAVIASYNDLMNNIVLWEQKYLLKAPFDGKVQFLKFWTTDQFVQAGEPVFTILPLHDEPYGQIFLPAFGAGKVKTGQEVIIKLDDYPYVEYGSVSGVLTDISLTTNTETTSQGKIETYLATVKFKSGLISNYGKKLAFRHESKGTAEIITKNRKLIDRFFDNLKYATNK